MDSRQLQPVTNCHLSPPQRFKHLLYQSAVRSIPQAQSRMDRSGVGVVSGRGSCAFRRRLQLCACAYITQRIHPIRKKTRASAEERELSPSVTVVTGRHDPSRSGRSAEITYRKLDKPSRTVTIRKHRNDYSLSTSPTDKQSRTVTICHRCDGSSRSVPIGTICRNYLAHHYTAMNTF